MTATTGGQDPKDEKDKGSPPASSSSTSSRRTAWDRQHGGRGTSSHDLEKGRGKEKDKLVLFEMIMITCLFERIKISMSFLSVRR